MEKIVFLDRGTLTVPMRKPKFAHEWTDYERTTPSETVERLEAATIAISNKVRLGPKELSELPNLKLIAVTATGVNNIDIEGCRKKKIAVANVPGYAWNSVSEHVMMLMLALRRNLPALREGVRTGRWQASGQAILNELPMEDLRGTVLGLVGYGEVAKAVAQLASAFGMKVLVAERKGKTPRAGRRLFDDVLREADVVSLHAPLTEETRGLIGARELALMSRTALLINTARGDLLDEQALAEALKAGRLGGAGIDVLSQEPPMDTHPLIALHLPNLIVTPHVAWAGRQTQELLAEEVVKNMEAFMVGKSRNRVA